MAEQKVLAVIWLQCPRAECLDFENCILGKGDKFEPDTFAYLDSTTLEVTCNDYYRRPRTIPAKPIRKPPPKQ